MELSLKRLGNRVGIKLHRSWRVIVALIFLTVSGGFAAAQNFPSQSPEPPALGPGIGPEPVPGPEVGPGPEIGPGRPPNEVEPPGVSPDFAQPSMQPTPPDFNGNQFDDFDTPQNGRASSLGATRGSFSSSPTILGDFFGGGLSAFQGSQTVTRSFTVPGTILSGGPGQSSSILGFELDNDLIPNDIFTTGVGLDASNDTFADTFSILEPLPTSDAPTSPGPGFVFDPATATAVYVANSGGKTAVDGVYTSGENWFVSYAYTATIGQGPGGRLIPVPGPGVAARRVKIGENFSPDVRDRAYLNYSFFNDAFGGLGDISRYTLGAESVLVDDLISIEARLPLAATYANDQALDAPEQRNFELGNAAFIAKAVLLRDTRWLWTGGIGVGLPTSDDTSLSSNGRKILEVRNHTVHLLPFTAALYRWNQDWILQGAMQLDIAANSDPVYGDLTGNSRPLLGNFTDSTLMFLDLSATRSLYQSRCERDLIRAAMLNIELHYTGTLQESDVVSSDGIRYANLARNFNVLNTTVGMHFVLNDDLVVSPGVSLPMRDGLDEQFDYEAVLQVNYIP